MNTRQQLLATIRHEFDEWETLLARFSVEDLTTPHLRQNISIKDELAHLRVWQQISIARLEAGLHHTTPDYTVVPPFTPAIDDTPDILNAWAYEHYREQSWTSVYQAWREGFLRFLELGEAIPESDLVDVGKYPWLEGYALADVLVGSYEHHKEHRDALLEWQNQR